jgi:AraC-like DNA-binding protein
MCLLTISEKILSYTCWFGIVQGILLATLIYFYRKSDRPVNAFLAIYICSISTVMALPFIVTAAGWQNSYFFQPIPLLPGPFLFLYLKSFRQRITWRVAMPHLVPAFAFFFLAYQNISNLVQQYPDAREVTGDMLRNPGTLLLQLIKPIQQVIYFVLATRDLNFYRRSIKNLANAKHSVDLKWTRFLVNGYAILVSSFLVIFPLMLRYPEQFDKLLLVNMAIATPYIYGVSIKGLLRHNIWAGGEPGTTTTAMRRTVDPIESIEVSNDVRGGQNNKGVLPAERIAELARGIESLMEREKIYQETDLTLRQLADKLNAPAYQVSIALNEGMNRNFYDLVNSYRVEEAKRLLLDSRNRNYTILSVGYEAGFNSKTTFNTVFKKFTGLTPTEYREHYAVRLAVR